MTATEPLVLGIESSCDETGIGIVRGSKLLTNTISSSMEEHVRFGGVIPEIASRAHLEAMLPALEKALTEAGVNLSDIDAIAVTAGPGLAGALMVGVAAAKALAVATGKPLYGINHLVAHVGVGLLDDNGTSDGVRLLQNAEAGGLGALLVSGGHTEILQVRDITSDVRLLGATLDDAAGEAYDKVARLLGLDYPGGPAIDRAAKDGDRTAFTFPRGLSARKFMGSAEEPGQHRYDFSFSGLKTAVARVVEGLTARGEMVPVADIAASSKRLWWMLLRKKQHLPAPSRGWILCCWAGGVAANSRLRQLLAARCASAGVRLIIPKFTLCTDNGAMVAALGAQLVAAGREPSGVGFTADSSLPVTTVCL